MDITRWAAVLSGAWVALTSNAPTLTTAVIGLCTVAAVLGLAMLRTVRWILRDAMATAHLAQILAARPGKRCPRGPYSPRADERESECPQGRRRHQHVRR